MPKSVSRTLARAIARHWAWAVCLWLPGLALAQLNPAWDGHWASTASTISRASVSLQILRRSGQTQIIQDGQACRLVYDGTISPAAAAQRIAELQAWQLKPEHWPAGTRPEQLVGLKKEFDSAASTVAMLTAPSYRRARIQGEGCDDADEIFFVLHQGQRLLRIRFPSAALGVDISVFQKASAP